MRCAKYTWTTYPIHKKITIVIDYVATIFRFVLVKPSFLYDGGSRNPLYYITRSTSIFVYFCKIFKHTLKNFILLTVEERMSCALSFAHKLDFLFPLGNNDRPYKNNVSILPRELLKQLLGIMKRTKTENWFIKNNKSWTEVDDRLTLSFREEKVISGREVRTKLEAKLFHRQAERLILWDTIMSYFYLPQGKVMFLHLSVCSQGEGERPPPQSSPRRDMGPDRKWYHTPPPPGTDI